MGEARVPLPEELFRGSGIMKLLALSLILCWGLCASAGETQLMRESLDSDDGDELRAEHSTSTLAEEDLSEDKIGIILQEELGQHLDNEVSTDANSASDRWSLGKKWKKLKRRLEKKYRKAKRKLEDKWRKRKRSWERKWRNTKRRLENKWKNTKRRMETKWRKTKRGLENKWKKWKRSYDDLKKKVARYTDPRKILKSVGIAIKDVKNVIKRVRSGMRRVNYYWKMVRATRGFIRGYKPAPNRMLPAPVDHATPAMEIPEPYEEGRMEPNE